jgi:hypothetical protein
MRTLVAETDKFDDSDFNTFQTLQNMPDEELLGLLMVLSDPVSAAEMIGGENTVERLYATYDIIRELLIDRGIIQDLVQ